MVQAMNTGFLYRGMSTVFYVIRHSKASETRLLILKFVRHRTKSKSENLSLTLVPNTLSLEVKCNFLPARKFLHCHAYDVQGFFCIYLPRHSFVTQRPPGRFPSPRFREVGTHFSSDEFFRLFFPGWTCAARILSVQRRNCKMPSSNSCENTC